MKKYKLLKELPGIKAGTEFIYNVGDGRKGVELVGGRTIAGLLDFIKAFGIDNDFFEPIEEKKTFDTLERYDTVYFIHTNGNIGSTGFLNNHSRGEIFLTGKDAEDEHKRREWVNRKDKFVPEEKENYFNYNGSGNIAMDCNEGHPYDIFVINQGLVFRTKEECQDAIDNHDIVRLFYTIR